MQTETKNTTIEYLNLHLYFSCGCYCFQVWVLLSRRKEKQKVICHRLSATWSSSSGCGILSCACATIFFIFIFIITGAWPAEACIFKLLVFYICPFKNMAQNWMLCDPLLLSNAGQLDIESTQSPPVIIGAVPRAVWFPPHCWWWIAVKLPQICWSSSGWWWQSCHALGWLFRSVKLQTLLAETSNAIIETWHPIWWVVHYSNSEATANIRSGHNLTCKRGITLIKVIIGVV